MLKQVNNDFYNISNRIKQIFYKYAVYFDDKKHEYSVFTKVNNGRKIFEFNIGKKLDVSAIKKAILTSVKNVKKILKEIDQTNLKLENENANRTLDYSKDQLKVYLNYASKKNCDVDFNFVNKFKWI